MQGDDYSRGVQIGRAAKDSIAKNVKFYLDLWSKNGSSKDWVLSEAEKIRPVIEKYSSSICREMEGISEGSGLSFEEIVALNSRWEIFYINLITGGECTALCANEEATKEHHTLLGQNWDYLPAVRNNCILIKEFQEPERPDLLIHTEAGVIGHKGMNSKGLGLVVNGLNSDKDRFEQRVPFLVMLREALNQRNLTDALAAIVRAHPSVSGNIMLAQTGGLAIDVEVAPDDYAVLYDDDGLLSHANVFSDVRLSGKINDKIRTMYPDSMIRAARASKMMKKYVKKAKDVEAFKNSLADHFGYPNSVCRHPDPNEPEDKRAETLASVIMDLDTKTMWISNGNPCSNEFTEVKFDAIRGN